MLKERMMAKKIRLAAYTAIMALKIKAYSTYNNYLLYKIKKTIS